MFSSLAYRSGNDVALGGLLDARRGGRVIGPRGKRSGRQPGTGLRRWPATRPTAVAAVALLLALSAPAKVPPTPPPTFVAIERVEVVNVEVMVTDPEGRFVAGLPREAFTILEDGVPVELSNFAIIEAVRPQLSPTTGGAGEVTATPMPKPAAPSPSAPAHASSLVVWLDNINLRPGTRNEVLERVERLVVPRLEVGDLVMVVSWDRTLTVHTPFTGDIGAVRAALKAAASEVAGATAMALGKSEIIQRMDRPLDWKNPEGEAQGVLQAIDAYAESVYQENGRALERLRQFAAALAGAPGRKAVLVVSEGAPERPAEELYTAWRNRYMQRLGRFDSGASALVRANSRSLTPIYTEVVANASAAGVTFFTLLAGSLDRDGGATAEMRGVAEDGTRYWDASVSTLDMLNRVQPMFYLAAATGGRSVLNVNAGTLEAVSEDLDRYYSLGYRAPHPGDGKMHRIEVRLARADLRLRHRTFYRSKPAPERAADLAMATLLMPGGDNPLGVALDLRDHAEHNGKTLLLRAMVGTPLDRVALLPAKDGQEGRLRVILGVRDAEGTFSELQQMEVPIHIADADLASASGRRVGTAVQLQIRPGRQRLAIVVVDEISELTSRLAADLEIGADGTVAFAGGQH